MLDDNEQIVVEETQNSIVNVRADGTPGWEDKRPSTHSEFEGVEVPQFQGLKSQKLTTP